ncbi:MAG: HAD-IA family hydrolase [Clostridia bacterium]|nr:HAD-IA family hydrolase [Clostridia bacterium]MBR5923652.1 HAD-IA family hydrolase [Clostridia bacterium]
MGTVNLIFDLDGCLINSIEVQRQAFYGSYDRVVGDGMCPDFSEYLKHTGDSLPNIFRKMNLPVEMAEPYREISCAAIDKIIINDEAIALIRRMKSEGSKIAICTGKDRYRTLDILKYYGIDDCFDAIVASDDVSEPKPSGMSVLKAISDMGVKKETCIVIGDGYNDILSARDAGVKVVLTLWYGDEGVSREADYTAHTVAQLEEVLKKYKV